MKALDVEEYVLMKSSFRCEVQNCKHMRMKEVDHSHQYPPILFPGVTLICVLVHREIQFVCIFDAAIGKLDCEEETHNQELVITQKV